MQRDLSYESMFKKKTEKITYLSVEEKRIYAFSPQWENGYNYEQAL